MLPIRSTLRGHAPEYFNLVREGPNLSVTRVTFAALGAAAEAANPAQIPANNTNLVNLVKNFDTVRTSMTWISPRSF